MKGTIQRTWAMASLLHERAVRALPHGPQEEGAARLQTWKAKMAVDDETFRERLAMGGLTESDLLHLLGDTDPEWKQGTEGPAWANTLEALASGFGQDEPLPDFTALVPGAPDSGKVSPFYTFIRPFLRFGARQLRVGVSKLREEYGGQLLAERVEAQLLSALARRLSGQCAPTLMLELNTARLLERLEGETPEARFQYFAEVCLGTPQNWLALCEEYQVLARLMMTTLSHWVESSLEFLERVASDRSLIGTTFLGQADPGELAAIQCDSGDSHCRGRSVILCQFTSGLRLVYKPHSLAVDRQFQELLGWLNATGLRHPHRLLLVADRSNYGWVEHIAAAGCATADEVKRFYWRQGSYLALLYVLHAVDFHFENLIAAGEHPVLIDLEGLMHHRFPDSQGRSAAALAMEELNRSVLKTGMLPMRIMGVQGRKGVDISGLGGEDGQYLPKPMHLPAAVGTDSMHLAPRDVKLEGAKNRPALAGATVDPTTYVEETVAGFEETYKLLMAHREQAIAMLKGFAGVTVRHIVRPTRQYASYLRQGHHPDLLRDGLDRDMLLDMLWAASVIRGALQRVVPHEQADLRNVDIPFFTARPGERHLWTSSGVCIADFFAEDSLSVVLDRLAHLDDEDLAAQAALIREAMAVIDRQAHVRQPAPRTRNADAPTPSRDSFLQAASRIGDHLLKKAIFGEDDVCWNGLILVGGDHTQCNLGPVGTNLYGGVGGIALFLAYLGAATGRPEYERTARAGLQVLRSDLTREYPPGVSPIGAFTGRAGHLYVMSHLAALWHEPSILAEALNALEMIEREVSNDQQFDLLGGSAGTLLVCLDLFRQTGDPRLLRVARRCGDRLVEGAAPYEHGVGWRVPAAEQLPIAGFSHGCAGIAWALLELAAATGDHQYGHVARQALAYERSLFLPERGNWKDLRVPDAGQEPAVSTAWCNGAPGIGLGRLLVRKCLQDPLVDEEIAIALGTTAREGFGMNHSLCHGDLGAIDILLTAGRVMKDTRWDGAAMAEAAQVLADVEQGIWRCGVPRQAHTPGLMMGLAGIGMGLLRLWSPARIPSVLWLQPPARER
ncbi:MAG TPA: type 2 lanthipeptide synthetase LanM family protein [Symbiobacteriaceae bacterium]|nr:type 2 lanthipeptide synthetase LanM family protein [Symbiobacteriaceae bacterium]